MDKHVANVELFTRETMNELKHTQNNINEKMEKNQHRIEEEIRVLRDDYEKRSGERNALSIIGGFVIAIISAVSGAVVTLLFPHH